MGLAPVSLRRRRLAPRPGSRRPRRPWWAAGGHAEYALSRATSILSDLGVVHCGASATRLPPESSTTMTMPPVVLPRLRLGAGQDLLGLLERDGCAVRRRCRRGGGRGLRGGRARGSQQRDGNDQREQSRDRMGSSSWMSGLREGPPIAGGQVARINLQSIAEVPRPAPTVSSFGAPYHPAGSRKTRRAHAGARPAVRSHDHQAHAVTCGHHDQARVAGPRYQARSPGSQAAADTAADHPVMGRQRTRSGWTKAPSATRTAATTAAASSRSDPITTAPPIHSSAHAK